MLGSLGLLGLLGLFLYISVPILIRIDLSYYYMQ